MADDGDADKVEQPARPPVTAPGRARSEASEWTASDRRGPLGEATAEQERAAAQARAGEAAEGQAPTGGPEHGRPEADPTHADPTDPTHAEPAHAEPTDAAAAPAPGEAAPVEPSPEAPRRHVPVLPMIVALVVGAVIGAGSAAVVYKSSDQGASQGEVDALASRLESLEKRPDPQPELDRLKAAVAKASAPKPAQAPAAPAQAPAAPAFDPAPLQEKIAGLQGDVAALKKQAGDQALADKVGALGGTVAALQKQADEVKGVDTKVAALASSIDGLKKEDQSAQAGIAALQSGQKSLEGKTGAPALAVAADSLVAAIDQGRPYAGQVEALAGLGADPAKIAVLRENADKGVPSAQVLAAKFAPLADPIVATASQAPPNAGLGDRLKSGLLGLVSVRRSDATAGDDVASRVARIQADLAHGDVAGAYTTWSGLPADAKAKSDAWGALAKTQVTAMAAARALQGQAIAALGGKKS